MLVLLDRGFDGNAFLAEIAGTGAVLLARAKSTRNPAGPGAPARRLLPVPAGPAWTCGSIEAEMAMTGADGTRIADSYRLITTLTDHRAYPAEALVRLYHERWEIESAYLACGIPCWTAGCCARVTGPASSRNCGRC